EENAERCGRRKRALHGRKVGHIEHQYVGLLAAVTDRGHGRFDFRLCTGGERDMRPGIGQRKSRRKADAASGARHERPLAVETKGWTSRDLHGYCAAPAYGTFWPP